MHKHFLYPFGRQVVARRVPPVQFQSGRSSNRCGPSARAHEPPDITQSRHSVPPGGQILACSISSAATRKQLSGRAEQRRFFRDYFTAHLPGSSLHPDPPPPKATRQVHCIYCCVVAFFLWHLVMNGLQHQTAVRLFSWNLA